MRICEKCGHQNWKVREKCEKCGKKYNQEAQCDPMIGQGRPYTYDAYGCYYKQIILDSDNQR